MPGMAELFKRKGSGASNNGKHGAAASAERGDPNFVAVEGASMTMYDADNDGRIDHVERTLAKYDLNHDGKFSAAEVKTIIAEVVAAKKTKLKYQRITAALCVCIAALLASMFGAAVLASELSKEAFVDSETGAQLSASGEPTRIGTTRPYIGEMHEERRRRLVEIDGRRMVEVAEVNTTVASALAKAMNATGQTTGTVEVGTSNLGARLRRGLAEVTASTLFASGQLMRTYTKRVDGKDETWYDFRSALSTDRKTYTVTGDGQVLASDPDADRRLRRLSETEAHAHHARRRLHAEGQGKRPEPCHIYHCFEGDARCSDPAPRTLCMAWSADGARCEEPACAFVLGMLHSDEPTRTQLAAERRRRLNDPVATCGTDADCANNTDKKICFGFTGVGLCIECISDSDCEQKPHGCWVEQREFPQRKCNLNSGNCVSCLTDDDCSSATTSAGSISGGFECTSSGTCVQCQVDSDCPELEECSTEGECATENCFPAHATVTTPTGPKRMDELEVGDRVLVDGGAAYSTVYLHAHEDRRADVRHDFVRVELSTGHELELSPDHLARLADGTYEVAADVRVGMKMHVATAEPKSVDESSAAAVVTATSLVRRAGLFAPITLHGDIVVDGVVASSYASIMSSALPPPLRRSGTLLNALVHALAAPTRALHTVDPALLEHIMQTVPRTESGGFSPFSFRGAGGLLAIKEAINSGLAVVPPPSLARRALAATAAYGWLATASTIAAASSMLGSAANATSAVAAALLGVAAVATKGGGVPESK